MDKKAVLVTGASGYIGSHLVKEFVRQGREVHVTMRSSSNMDMLGSAVGDITCHTCDDPSADLAPIFERGIGTVFHLAAFTDHRDDSAFAAMLNANYIFGAYLLEAMSAHDVKNLVCTGSVAEHAGGTAKIQPQSVYAATKSALYPLVDFHVDTHGLSAVTLKLFDVYGPDDPRPKLLGALRQAVEDGATLDVSEGTQKVTYVHISDVVAAFQQAERSLKPASHQTFFAPGPEMRPLREYIEIYAALAERDDLVNFGARPHDENVIMNPYVGEVLPGWSAKVRAEEGFKALLPSLQIEEL